MLDAGSNGAYRRRMKPLFVLLSLLLPVLVVFSAKRPSVLFAFADDWGRQASIYAKIEGAGGINSVAKTPHFDKLAKSGVLFTNASVNAPSCTPCRRRHPFGAKLLGNGEGSYSSRGGLGREDPDLAFVAQGFGIPYRLYLQSLVARHSSGCRDWRTGQCLCQGRREIQRLFPICLRAGLQRDCREGCEGELYREARGNFKSFLEDRKKDQPFAYWFGPTSVHRKWTKGSGKKLWGIDPDGLKGKMPAFLPDVHAVREDLADYLGEIAAFDAGLGILIEELKKAGEYENTIIVVSGDHGPPGFPHGKCNLYDFGTRVCLAIAGPGVKGGRVVDDFVCLPDLAPTFVEAGKVEVPGGMSAKSLWKVLKSKKEGQVDPNRDAVVTGRERPSTLPAQATCLIRNEPSGPRIFSS